jgi:uncharacterized Zn finger protein
MNTPLPRITEAMIRQLTDSQSYGRGQSYYQSGAVLSLARRGNQITAEVEGSQYEPYQVTVTFDTAGITSVFCTCPVGMGCKHVVATLLTYLHKPDEVTERPVLDTLLAGLDESDLRGLVAFLVERQPNLMDWVESYAQTAQAKLAQTAGEQKAPPRQHKPLDPEPFRRQVRSILRHSSRYDDWGGSSIAADLEPLAVQVQPFLEAGDGRNALVILEAITDGCIPDAVEQDYDGEVYGFIEELALLWAEALLTADLTADERQEWIDQLEDWQGEADEYGGQGELDVAIAAAEQGWDDPTLVQILRGQIPAEEAQDEGDEEDEEDWEAGDEDDWEDEWEDTGDLARVRLKILERQRRQQEYLYLAQATKQNELFVTKLVEWGQVEKAIEYGRQHVTDAKTALALAKALRGQGAIEPSLEIARRGLTLYGHKVALGQWLRDAAAGIGKIDLALEAGLAVFREQPTLADYRAIEPLAGNDWPQLKQTLLRQMREKSPDLQHRVDIFLHEGMVREAIEAVNNSPYAHYGLIERVVDAAINSHPEWVIQACKKQAEPIMTGGQAKYYDAAARWLDKARAAYLVAGRKAEWSDYLNKLLAEHGRKYKLVPLLKQLL